MAPSPIPPHPAVRETDADGRAAVSVGVKFPGGKKGVALSRRDESVIGYPIALSNGRFLVAAKFGRHAFYGAAGAGAVFFALGRQVGRKAAEAAYAKHPSQRRRTLEAARIADSHTFDAPHSPLVRRLGELVGVTYWAAEDGTAVAQRADYDHPVSYWRLTLTPSEVGELLPSRRR